VRARRHAVLAAAALAAGASACGADEERENALRPPAPINVTAAIDAERVRVSPQSFGAGPVVIVISNQSGTPQEVTFETDEIDGDAGGIRRSTGPIAARGTGTLKVDPREGSYMLAASTRGIRPARVAVSAPRESAQDRLDVP
jgi:hypothetical protein